MMMMMMMTVIMTRTMIIIKMITMTMMIIGTLRSNDSTATRKSKKTIGFISKTKTLHVHHAFLYISLPVFARLRRENA